MDISKRAKNQTYSREWLNVCECLPYWWMTSTGNPGSSLPWAERLEDQVGTERWALLRLSYLCHGLWRLRGQLRLLADLIEDPQVPHLHKTATWVFAFTENAWCWESSWVLRINWLSASEGTGKTFVMAWQSLPAASEGGNTPPACCSSRALRAAHFVINEEISKIVPRAKGRSIMSLLLDLELAEGNVLLVRMF